VTKSITSRAERTGRGDSKKKKRRNDVALQIARVRVDELAPGGAGVARLEDGEVVFVRATAPEDLVEVALDRRRRPTHGELRRVVEPGPDRVEAACPHVGECGGCDWMHMAWAAQRREHARIATSAVARALKMAGLSTTSLPVRTLTVGEPLGYRSRARLYVRAGGGRARVGYRMAKSHQIVEVDSCAVLDETLVPTFGELRDAMHNARGSGDGTIALGSSSGGRRRPVVDLTFDGELSGGCWAAIDERVSSGAWAGARVALAGVDRPAVFGDPRPVLIGEDDVALSVAAGGFTQSSDAGARVLGRCVAEEVAPEGQHVVELYAGSGTLSVYLARGAASYWGIEQDESAVRAARENLAKYGLSGKITAADASQVDIPSRAGVVVLDPPRTGALEACRRIAAARARRVVYISCDAQTLSRDLEPLFAAGHRLSSMTTVELFPQTSHVETVVRLDRPRH